MSESGLIGVDDVGELLAAANTAARLRILTSTGPIGERRLEELLDQAEERVHSNPGEAEALSLLVEDAAAAAVDGAGRGPA